MIYICATCDSDNIRQEVIAWINPNDPDATDIVDSSEIQKSYFCHNCDETCYVNVVED